MISFAELTLWMLVGIFFLTAMALPWLLAVMTSRKGRRH